MAEEFCESANAAQINNGIVINNSLGTYILPYRLFCNTLLIKLRSK